MRTGCALTCGARPGEEGNERTNTRKKITKQALVEVAIVHVIGPVIRTQTNTLVRTRLNHTAGPFEIKGF